MKEEIFKMKRRKKVKQENICPPCHAQNHNLWGKKVKQENICPEDYDFEHDKVKMEEIETMG